MKGYRDAFHPPPPSPPPIHRTGSDQGDHDHDQSPTPQNRRTSSPPPLFDEPNIDSDFDDGIDMDEMAAMEEMEREEASRSRSRPTNGAGDDGPPRVLEEEDDWEGLYD